MKYEVDFYSEVCCDLCGEVVHNHFDCPICKTKDAATSIYCNIYELEEDEKNFTCEDCDSKFKIIGYNDKTFNWILEYNKP